jgi:hypothetical protein
MYPYSSLLLCIVTVFVWKVTRTVFINRKKQSLTSGTRLGDTLIRDVTSNTLFYLPIHTAVSTRELDTLLSRFFSAHFHTKCYENSLVPLAFESVIQGLLERNIGNEILVAKLRQKYVEDTKTALLSGYVYPDADVRTLCVVNLLFFWLWLMDDLAVCKTKEDEQERKKVYALVRRILRSWNVVDGCARIDGVPIQMTHPLEKLTSYMLEVISEYPMVQSQTGWVYTYLDDMEEFMVCEEKLSDERVTGGISYTVEAYLPIRYVDSAVKLAFHLYELQSGGCLTPSLAKDARFIQYRVLAGLMVALANDAFSYHLEAHIEDTTNILRIIQTQYGLTFPRAVFVLNVLIEQIFSTLNELETSIRGNTSLSATDKQYLFGLKCWVTSSFDWPIQCARYHNDVSEFPELCNVNDSIKRHHAARVHVPYVTFTTPGDK